MTNTNSLDSIIPEDFPRELVNKILERVACSKYGQTEQFPHFIDAWTAIVYRFSSCAEHDIAYRDSIRRVGTNTPRLEHYIQERELFGFFICGLTVLESFYYSCYSLASMLDGKNFSFDNPKIVQPTMTANKFAKFHRGERLTKSIDKLRNDAGYKSWSETRNVLAHRIIPARLNKVTLWPVTARISHEVSWMNDTILLDGNTTATRREWLAKTLHELMSATDNFTSTHFS